jgi:hypothetical protein
MVMGMVWIDTMIAFTHNSGEKIWPLHNTPHRKMMATKSLNLALDMSVK